MSLPATPLDIDPILVSPKEAARLLNFGQTKIFALLKDGTLESTKIGYARRISVASIKALAKCGTAGTPPK
jgi:excisionase family DNA binding protein